MILTEFTVTEVWQETLRFTKPNLSKVMPMFKKMSEMSLLDPFTTSFAVILHVITFTMTLIIITLAGPVKIPFKLYVKIFNNTLWKAS